MSKYLKMVEIFKSYEKILHPDFFWPIQKAMNEYHDEVKQQVISDYFSDEEVKLIESIRDYKKRKENKGYGIDPEFFLEGIINKIKQ